MDYFLDALRHKTPIRYEYKGHKWQKPVVFIVPRRRRKK